MMKMKFSIKAFLVVMVLVISGCETPFDEVNIDPNNSPTAQNSQVLSSALGQLGYMVDANLNSSSFLWAQYYTWGIGVSIGNQERYVSEPRDFDAYWGRAYSEILIDLKYLRKGKSLAYKGVGDLLTAYVFQGLVDHFGNIPYSEAISGQLEDGGIQTPKYDDAASVYAELVKLVDEGLTDLAVAPAEIGADDYVYQGNLSKWIKFGNSLKLKLLMRLSEVAPKGDAVKALVAGNNFIENSSDVAAMPFSGVAGSQKPMYASFEFGVGDFYFASNATVNVLNDLNDPRLNAFYTPASSGTFNGQIRGINQGTINNEPFTAPASDYSGSSSLAYGPANSVILMSDWEVWFLRAEAAARYGTADNDASAFANAISNNFSYLGVDGASTYISSLNYGGSLDNKLDKIAVQKWIAMNGTQEDEGWIETRRFDRPSSRLFTNGIFQYPPLSVLANKAYPASWLYPATERSLNPNAPAQRAITDKIFWDN